MLQIKQILSSPFLVRRFIRNIKCQEKFLRENLGQLLDDAAASTDGSLDAGDFKKIYKYYGLAVPAILGEEIATLHGKKMSRRERLALTYLGAFTGLFDDFFDKHHMPVEKIGRMVEEPQAVEPSNDCEKLFLVLYQEALDLSHHPKLTREYLTKVLQAQVSSLKQARPGLSRDEIREITIDKGGVSVLFYRSAFEKPLGEPEADAFYKMGGLMQFGNDIFDVYKDSKDGIHTLMTTIPKVESVRQLFQQMQVDAFSAFDHCGFAPRSTIRFRQMVSLSLCSRCYVCFDQYQELQNAKGGNFYPQHHTRGELICDLDNTKNKWRSVKYHWKQDCRPFRRPGHE